MIDRATVDRILDSVRIEEVIGDFVSLRKRGSNYLGLCPFHQDKNPSMSVSATKGIFKCFSCGKAGTAVSFLMDHEHLSYPDALRYLAKKYNIDIVEKEETPEEIAGRMKYESLLVVSEYAQKFYQDILWNTDTGRAIGLSYFRERKFTDETIRKFGLGYAAARGNEFHKDAVRHGYKPEYLVDSGLCIRRDNGDLADRFFDRVMFPIHSLSGRVIAFGGRTLKSDKTVAKYVNSPETEIYIKRNNLYGLFQAKSAIVKADKCILVEGYADVISMHQAGIENVVASSGTSLTVEQIRLIKRFTEKITVIYDGDEAGIKASLRGIDLILEQGLSVKVVLLPPQDDPDSFAKAHPKIEILEYIEENEKDFIAYKSDILSRDVGNDPLRKSQMINDIIQSISVIPDPILRNIYVDMVVEQFGQKSDSIHQKVAQMRRRKQSVGASWREPRNEPQSRTERPEPQARQQYRPALLQDADLAVPEKEMTGYLLKWGEYTLHMESNMYLNGEKLEEPTVSEYIRTELEADGRNFVNEPYRTIFRQYYDYVAGLEREEPEEMQKKVIRHFSTHENKDVTEAVLDIVCDSHPLTVKEFENALEPEELTLGRVVPKTIIDYRLRIVRQMCNQLTKKIAELQHSEEVDQEKLKAMVKRLQTLNKVKNRYSKEINRL